MTIKKMLLKPVVLIIKTVVLVGHYVKNETWRLLSSDDAGREGLAVGNSRTRVLMTPEHENKKPLPIGNHNDTSEEHMAGRVQAGVTSVQSYIPYRSFGRSVRIFRNFRLARRQVVGPWNR